MTNEQKILKYLDRLPRNIPITSKRISLCAASEVIDKQIVCKIMDKLVDEGKWGKLKCWSTDGTIAYQRKG